MLMHLARIVLFARPSGGEEKKVAGTTIWL